MSFILASGTWTLVATNHAAYKCPYITHGNKSTLVACQASCDAIDLCTAINYHPDKDCVLRQCSTYPPVTEHTDKYVVWARKPIGKLQVREKKNAYDAEQLHR